MWEIDIDRMAHKDTIKERQGHIKRDQKKRREVESGGQKTKRKIVKKRLEETE
jgi:hypothetical protein